MNQNLFRVWMCAADSALLEEAQMPRKHSTIWLRVGAGAVVACLCVAAVGVLWHRSGQPEPPASGDTQLANPMHAATAAELEQLGYSLPLPADAQDAAYFTIDRGTDATPMAQVTFLKSGQTYTCRALKTETSTDISGIYADWSEQLNWQVDTLDVQLRSSADSAWVGWFSADAQTQWCLSGPDGDALSLLHTAREIVDTLGYNMETAPSGAGDVVYNAFALDGLTVAETCFRMDGVGYAYRTAATSAVDEDFADISGMEADYAVRTDGTLGWCPARLSYTEGGSGKIVWFDVVPWLLYSLTMDSGASEAALTTMAEQVFQPAQSDVG